MRASQCVTIAAFGLVLTSACAEDPPPPPPPPPTLWTVTVVDAESHAPIARARVLPQRPSAGTGAGPLGRWHEADDSGSLTLELDPGTYPFRVEAAGHHPSPEPFASAPPTFTVVKERTIKTRVELDARTSRGAGVIRGSVTADGAMGPLGALVVASSAEEGSATTDETGAFEITDLSPSTYQVSAFFAGHSGDPVVGVMATAAAPTEGVAVMLRSGATGRLGPTTTSTLSALQLWLVHPRLGVPLPGLSVVLGAGAAIEGVPPGTFRARVGLELDGFVLDPEPIRADGPVDLVFPGAVAPAFAATLVRAIGGLTPAQTSSVAARPTFRWSPVPNADFYVVELRDLDGVQLWGGFDAAGSPRTRVFQTMVAYDGPVLRPGARYRWRVFAGENDLIVTSQFALIAASEELDGTIRILR